MPFCPQCRYEYTKDIVKCPDCQVKLVQILPPEKVENFELVALHPLPGAFELWLSCGGRRD